MRDTVEVPVQELRVVVVSSIIALATMPRLARAQLLPALPAVDAVNASGQVGTIWPTPFSTIPKTTAENFDLWGWGVETEFHLPFNEGSKWEATLAVGYNQLSMSARIAANRRLRGTLRDLPSLSLYFGRPQGAWYVGATIAQSELVNGRLHRDPEPGMSDPGPIKIAASSFSAGLALGYEIGPLFVELSYVGRYFPSLAYDGIPANTSFPADLGERMYAGGLMLRVGGSLDVKKSGPTPTTFSCGGTTTVIPAGTEFDATCSSSGATVNLHKK